MNFYNPIDLKTLARSIVPPVLASLCLLPVSFSGFQNQSNRTADVSNIAAKTPSGFLQNTLPVSEGVEPKEKSTSPAKSLAKSVPPHPSSQPTAPQPQQKGAKTVTISVSAPGKIKDNNGKVLAALNSYDANNYGYKIALSPTRKSVRIETQGVIYVEDKWLNARVVELNFDGSSVRTDIIKRYPAQTVSQNRDLNVSSSNSRPQMSPYVRAFLDVIAKAEVGTLDESGYQSLVFNGKFSTYAEHPNLLQCGIIGEKEICSTAAGRYQFLTKTWNDLDLRLGLRDFSPYNQDLAAIELIREKGALPYVEAGDFQTALMLVNTIWAGLPGSPHDQNPIDEFTALQFAYDRLNVYLASKL